MEPKIPEQGILQLPFVRRRNISYPFATDGKWVYFSKTILF